MRGAGVVQVIQPAKGQRFTLDSILLADFCRVKPKERVLEPGGGTGIISLLLARKHPRSLFYPVEVQEDLYSLCKENIRQNGLDNVIPVRRDVRRLSRSIETGGFSVIVANPPYIKEGTGRISPLDARRISRQDHAASLETWLNLQRFLMNGGRYCLVFTVVRLAELFALMRTRSLEPKRLRLVHPRADKPASIVLLEAVKSGGTGMEILPPLIVHMSDGSHTDEMRDIYSMPR